MAEFLEVMKQLNRLCTTSACGPDCPMQCMGCCGNIGSHCSRPIQAERIEKTVMQWAAENPEPVYPTWKEWLQSVGVMESSEGLLSRLQGQLLIDGIPAYALPTSKVLQPMDADIAQKLGMEPKEVT